jgi:hypothetical protein
MITKLWVTTDGRRFESESEGNQHQECIELKALLLGAPLEEQAAKTMMAQLADVRNDWPNGCCRIRQGSPSWRFCRWTIPMSRNQAAVLKAKRPRSGPLDPRLALPKVGSLVMRSGVCEPLRNSV